MSHVAEGELHAWLDGALEQLGEGRGAQVREHLRSCAVCREALVAEEALRARAAEVLALAAPRPREAPPFETLVERARAGGAPPRVVSRMARVGWAASVVLALGAGWTARELGLRATATPSVAVSVASAAADGIGREADGARVASGGVDEASPELAVANPRSEEGSAAAGADAVTRALAAGPAVRGRGPEVEELARATPAARESLELAVAARNVIGGGAGAPAVEERASPRVGGGSVGSEPVFAAIGVPPLATPPVAPPALTPQPLADQASEAAASVATETQRREASRAQRPMASAVSAIGGVGLQQPGRDTVSGVPRLFTTPAGGRADVGTVSGIADADEAKDLTVPGLEVLHVEWSQLASGQPTRRVLQRLMTGDTLEIRFVRSVPRTAADPVATLVSTGPLPGWNQVVRAHRDGWLVARAAIPPEELEALVDRAGTGR